MGAENLAPTRIRSPDRPARSELLHRLGYPGSREDNTNQFESIFDRLTAHLEITKILNQTCPLTLILLRWRIWWAPNNASRWQMGFNSAFKGLMHSNVNRTHETTWKLVHAVTLENCLPKRQAVAPAVVPAVLLVSVHCIDAKPVITPKIMPWHLSEIIIYNLRNLSTLQGTTEVSILTWRKQRLAQHNYCVAQTLFHEPG